VINKIVVHCSDSPHGRGDEAQTIHRWHLERGWDGIGYHWVITEDGTQQAGRPWYWTPAHIKGPDEGSIAICLIGRDEFTGEQLHTLRELYNELCTQWPHAEWFNHYDLDPGKTCPNFDAVAFLRG
jgi:hypothetical protein